MSLMSFGVIPLFVCDRKTEFGGSGRAAPSFGVIELSGPEVTIHCAAKGRLLNHRFIVVPLDMEARAKGEGGGTGFA